MSSRKSYVRGQFAAIMREQGDLATYNTPVAPHHVEPPSGSVPAPSHPAFNQLEKVTMKELQDVSTQLSLPSIQPRAQAMD